METAATAFNMQERLEPNFTKFGAGEIVEGILLRIDTVQVGERKQNVTRYTVEDMDTGALTSFLGSYQLDTRLRPNDFEHFVSIRCEGSDLNIVRNGNPMKLFKVFVSDIPARTPQGVHVPQATEITNADLAF